MRENFQVRDFQLTPDDMESLDSLNRNIRYFVDPLEVAPFVSVDPGEQDGEEVQLFQSTKGLPLLGGKRLGNTVSSSPSVPLSLGTLMSCVPTLLAFQRQPM
ncbi:prostaglandin F synthase 1 isoform X1 [Prionailurus iriomotensis]